MLGNLIAVPAAVILIGWVMETGTTWIWERWLEKEGVDIDEKEKI